MAAKTRTLRNRGEDVKDLGIICGKAVVMGSVLDEGLIGLKQPIVEVDADQWAFIQGNLALKATLDSWMVDYAVVVE
jgi:hypothetical protein